jgi:hypothetical protein
MHGPYNIKNPQTLQHNRNYDTSSAPPSSESAKKGGSNRGTASEKIIAKV